MDAKLAVLVLFVVGLLFDTASADFFYNRSLPRPDELANMNLKCIPGRTVIKVTNRSPDVTSDASNSDEYTRSKAEKLREAYSLRLFDSDFTLFKNDDDESCRICICSVSGTDEVCIKRPAGSLNECMLMKQIADRQQRGEPFQQTSNLAYRIRRDLLWHNDEIPYDPSARCYRGHSYYTNLDTPNETTIENYNSVPTLLDYDSATSCFFCVCSTSGHDAGCIPRSLWFCNYYRYLRNENAARDMYASMFEQDRPAYFRQLSWRVRRTMDDKMFDLIEQGGDTLCCEHPDGHRRQIHNNVRAKLNNLKKRVPKENLLGGSMAGADYVDFVVNND